MTPVRIILGSVVVALALSAALTIHSVWKAHQVSPAGRSWCGPERRFSPCKTPHWEVFPATYRKASWQDSLAIFVTIAGLGVGAAIIVSRKRADYSGLHRLQHDDWEGRWASGSRGSAANAPTTDDRDLHTAASPGVSPQAAGDCRGDEGV